VLYFSYEAYAYCTFVVWRDDTSQFMIFALIFLIIVNKKGFERKKYLLSIILDSLY